MKNLLVNFLLMLLRWLGHSPSGLPLGILEAARFATEEVEKKSLNMNWSGEAKRAQALRALMNLCPGERERDLGRAIEESLN